MPGNAGGVEIRIMVSILTAKATPMLEVPPVHQSDMTLEFVCDLQIEP